MSPVLEKARGGATFTPRTRGGDDFSGNSAACFVNQFTTDDAEWTARIEELWRLRRLRYGWDGESAVAPPSELVDGALSLAQILRDQREPAPDRVVAGVNGTIAFEWFTPLGYREIEVDSPNSGSHRWVENNSKLCVANDLNWNEWSAWLGPDLREVSM